LLLHIFDLFSTAAVLHHGLRPKAMNTDQDWHPFNPEDRDTYPNDIFSVQVIFANGKRTNGDWLYGHFFNVSVLPEVTITRWRYI
jgi:hypothetical protein